MSYLLETLSHICSPYASVTLCIKIILQLDIDAKLRRKEHWQDIIVESLAFNLYFIIMLHTLIMCTLSILLGNGII
jgi:hypothetical protein